MDFAELARAHDLRGALEVRSRALLQAHLYLSLIHIYWSLLLAQRLQGIHAGGAPSRQIGRQGGGDSQ